jgi:hypothetical protein
MKHWLLAWKWFQHLLSFVGALSIIATVVFFNAMSPADTSTPVLSGHPDAVWRGAQDGGYYVEITRSNPPDYFVQVRGLDSTVEREGWARFITPDGKPLESMDRTLVTYLSIRMDQLRQAKEGAHSEF